jgi:hypothetical protein
VQVAIKIECEDEEPRRAERFRTSAAATLRPFRSGSEPIRIVDMSTTGCGFESRWPFREGMTALLYLPGLEPWTATVKWWDDGRGGIEFVRPLHPAVADRFAATIAIDG